jgi:hypothetical protein
MWREARAMHRKFWITLGVVFGMAASLSGSGALASGGEFAGPGPGITGNDTGGIFPYSPDVDGSYQQISEGYCARWGRMAKVTSIHRKYGDYVSFVCYDRPGRIH